MLIFKNILENLHVVPFCVGMAFIHPAFKQHCISEHFT